MPEFWYNACKCSLSYSGGLGWFVYDNPALTLLLPVLFFPLSPCLHSSPPHPPLQLLPHLPTVFLFLCLPTLSPRPSYNIPHLFTAFLFPDNAIACSYQPILVSPSHKTVGGWRSGAETEGTPACHRKGGAIQHLPVQCQQLLCCRLWHFQHSQQIQCKEWWASCYCPWFYPTHHGLSTALFTGLRFSSVQFTSLTVCQNGGGGERPGRSGQVYKIDRQGVVPTRK